jgi:hypothetical protein
VGGARESRLLGVKHVRANEIGLNRVGSKIREAINDAIDRMLV